MENSLKRSTLYSTLLDQALLKKGGCCLQLRQMTLKNWGKTQSLIKEPKKYDSEKIIYDLAHLCKIV